MRRAWTNAEEDVLRTVYGRIIDAGSERGALAALAGDLGRTPGAVYMRIAKLGLSASRRHRWRPRDDRLLLRLARRGVAFEAIAAQLGRTTAAVTARYNKLKKTTGRVS